MKNAGTFAIVGSAWLLAAGCAAEPGVDDAETLEQELLGECTTTTQCKSMYGESAYDCSNSSGGVCLCGSNAQWCSSLDDGDGCGGDGDCAGSEYCNKNQGYVCTPDRPSGSNCKRAAQCASNSCVDGECAGGGDPLGPSDPGNPARYTGTTHWKASSGTLTFLSDGKLPNTHDGWTVPSEVKKLVIAEDVRVSGRFNVKHSLEIAGQSRKTSEIFGTDEQGYNKNHDGCGYCKSAVLGEGEITVTVKNLTSRNPYGFHFTGKEGARFVIDSIDAIDDRGGHGNNSDGVSAADGTVVRNSYFETGDDVIKVYADIVVEDTHIEMIDNTVPIQFGWGDYGSGAHGVFRNLEVTGNGGRGADDNALISARKGRYDKKLEIHGLVYENPNGVVMTAREARGTAEITIDDAKIDVRAFRGDSWSMTAHPKVCGVVYRNGLGAPSEFDCRQ